MIAPENPDLAAALEQSGLGPDTHYAMAWVITWLGHDLGEYPELLHGVFDTCIAADHDLRIAFVAAALVLRYGPDVVAELGEKRFVDPAGFGDAHQALKMLPLRLVLKRRVGGSVHATHREKLRGAKALRPPSKLRKRDRIAALEGLLADARNLEGRYLRRLRRAADGADEGSASDGDNGGDDTEATTNNSSMASNSKPPTGLWRTLALAGLGFAVHVGVSYIAASGGSMEG